MKHDSYRMWSKTRGLSTSVYDIDIDIEQGVYRSCFHTLMSKILVNNQWMITIISLQPVKIANLVVIVVFCNQYDEPFVWLVRGWKWIRVMLHNSIHGLLLPYKLYWQFAIMDPCRVNPEEKVKVAYSFILPYNHSLEASESQKKPGAK